ncbi:hypothetical protein PISMIDRAFT_23588 [Pisolithus microcarpus 441]|uniref:Uncharacterized protein n=1 Tax=Pisolithus microcarpus 441 TaxID=765257 RepID=A0A0C9ZT04_9AGAM|nr:hypothetical protein BKA83DRAFT_23588 [Pisolithus microcarpus]KIK22868.1 hypothetical protein PISMIDRAFT_23588 [Pisolithus microcarpus 441]
MEVKILGLTVDAAEKEEKDVEKQCQKVAHAMMAEARASIYSAWGLVDELAEKSLVIQADHLWGLKDRESGELWNNLLDNEGMSMGHEIWLNKDTSPDGIIQVAFKNKLELDQHTQAGLSLAIKEVVSWVFTKYLASVQGQVKVYDASNLHTGLLEKKFLECLQQIINQYHDQMMQVTAFPKDHYKGMKQLVKALAPMTLNEASRKLLLATEGCRGAQKPWVWWDGIQDQPYCKNGLDASDEMSCMDIGEIWDNWANHITMENNGALPQDLWLAAGTMLRVSDWISSE